MGRCTVRWSVGKQLAPRGAGLGNEVFPWAKAYLGARALGHAHLEPPWRLNPRRYDKDLETSLPASIQYLAARVLPHADVTREVYNSTGCVDYFEAMKRLPSSIEASGKPVLLHSSAMSGGYLAIRRAKPFLRSRLLGSPPAVAARERLSTRTTAAVRVAVHVRGGDFQSSDGVQAKTFNQALPIEWYRAQVETLEAALSLPLEVLVATDSDPTAVVSALTIGAMKPLAIGTSSIADLAVLADADLIISSVSSFSLLASFLSESPYVWHRDQLGEAGGWLSIWGHESLSEGGGPTRESIAASAKGTVPIQRGLAQSTDPKWPTPLLDYLETRARFRLLHNDLIYYGVVPASGAAT